MARPSTIISLASPAGSMARSSAMRISRWGRTADRSSHWARQTAYRCDSSGNSSCMVSSAMQRPMNSSFVSPSFGLGIGIAIASFVGRCNAVRLVHRSCVQPANRNVPARNWRQIEDLSQLVRGHDAAVNKLDELQLRSHAGILQPVGLEHDLVAVADFPVAEQLSRKLQAHLHGQRLDGALVERIPLVLGVVTHDDGLVDSKVAKDG